MAVRTVHVPQRSEGPDVRAVREPGYGEQLTRLHTADEDIAELGRSAKLVGVEEHQPAGQHHEHGE